MALAGGPAGVEIDMPMAPPQEGGVVSHRLYPGIRTRSSTKQLGHFLPRYRELLGLRSADVYGVVPRGITGTTTSGRPPGSSTATGPSTPRGASAGRRRCRSAATGRRRGMRA
jgi:hypothetical protein